MRLIIEPNGRKTPLTEPLTWDQTKARCCGHPDGLLQMVMLYRWPAGHDEPDDPHVMLLDEEGATNWHPGYPLPINEEATKYYHANCIPGTTWPIRGTVYICPFSDFE